LPLNGCDGYWSTVTEMPGTSPSRFGTLSKKPGEYFCHQPTTAKFCDRM